MNTLNCKCGESQPGNIVNIPIEEYTYEAILEMKNFLTAKTSIKPKVGIICGSGLSALADIIKDPFEISYKDIPNFPVATAPGHVGKLIIGDISGTAVMCMQGRFHYYEGYSLAKCVMPIKLMKLMGVTHLIASNAAGGLNPHFKEGDFMLLKDHFNIMGLAGAHPLRGFNDPRWGARFFSMVNAYDMDLINRAKKIAKEMSISEKVHEGVYACTGGPTYGTIAELKALRMFGVDAVGMSTVHEIIAARHCDIRCFAFSLIAVAYSLEYENSVELSEEDVLNSAEEQHSKTQVFVEKLIGSIGKTESR